jgi:hypothetical protein
VPAALRLLAQYAFMRRLRARRAAALIGRRRLEAFGGALSPSRARPEGAHLTVDPIPLGLELTKRGPENRCDGIAAPR